MTREELVDEVSGHMHADQHVDAARVLGGFVGVNTKLMQTKEDTYELLSSLLYWNLNNDHYDWGAKMLWGDTLFNTKPRCTRMVWDNIKAHNSVLLQGGASMSKSYGAGGWLLLDWLRDPEFTSVNVVGPSEDHLKANLFTHLVTMHQNATLPLPGYVSDLFIGLDPKQRKSSIRGIIIPVGKRPAGRLQGTKRVPRKKPHPIFGKLSRLRFFLDEFEKIPEGIWKDIDNVFANLTTDVDGFKIIGAYNPENEHGPVASRAEPIDGWANFNADTDEEWTSKRGWRVVRLDPAKCENVIEGKEIYPGLQTKEGFDRIIQNAGGIDTPGYWTMARGCFPKQGGVYTVIGSQTIAKMAGEYVWAETPEEVGACDMSLEGGDAAEFAAGRFGRASGLKIPPSLDYPQGREIFFLGKGGKRMLKIGLQLDQLITLASGDTVKMATQVRDLCVKLKIAPGLLMLDRTGNGAGVHDLLKAMWSEEVRGVNYSSAATAMKILEEDSKTCKDEYERAASELWFALKKWAEFEFFKIHPSVQREQLDKELGGRRYASGKLNRVETKPEYKSRGNQSPNKADAITLLVHLVRVAKSIVPSAVSDLVGVVGPGHQRGAFVPCIVDPTNIVDDLEVDV